MNYRRAWHLGGTYFFIVNLLKNKNNNLLVEQVLVLRNAVAQVKKP